MHLQVTQQHLADFAVQFHVENGGMEGFFLDRVPQGVVINFNLLRLAGAAVNDAGRATGNAETAARTRTLFCALKSDEFHKLLLEEPTATSATPVNKGPPTADLLFASIRKPQKRFSWSENKLMTDSPLAMR